MLPMLTEQAWERFHMPLLQFIRRRVPDDETAEDLLQDVFLKIHQQIETLKDLRKLEGWVYQIARHSIIDYYRSKRMTVPLETPEVFLLPDELPDDDIVSELFPAVRAMVNSLSVQDRQALILTEYQGLTQKELGERLGISFSGAKSRVQRAREKLKQQLLACCHFELDRRGHILNYQGRCQCCTQDACCPEATEEGERQVRPFVSNAVSSDVQSARDTELSVPARKQREIGDMRYL